MFDPLTIKIEKGIKLPEKNSKWNSLVCKLKTNDSFAVPLKVAENFRGYAYKRGMKVAIRAMGNETSRVWILKTA